MASSNSDFIGIRRLRIARVLYDFVEQEALTDTGISGETFWSCLDALIHEFGPRNRAVLERRDELQRQIDAYHQSRPGQLDPSDYERFLRQIGYLELEPADFTIRTANVDAEIAHIAGPQLVVPVSNARYALNAANARWGSLYDALYGTDAIPQSGAPARG